MRPSSAISSFVSDESGAVTVDWVVITAAITGLGVAVAVTVATGTVQLGGSISGAVAQAPVTLGSTFRSGLSRLGELVSMDFSDGDTSGWSSDRLGFTDALGAFLGPFGGADGVVSYDVSLPAGANEATISFDLLVLDSWDANIGGLSSGRGDGMSVTIDGTEIAFELFMHAGHSQAGDYTGPRSGQVTIGDTTYATTMNMVSEGSFHGNTWTDQVWQVEISASNPPPGGFQLGLQGTLDQGIHDESFGIGSFGVSAQ